MNIFKTCVWCNEEIKCSPVTIENMLIVYVSATQRSNLHISQVTYQGLISDALLFKGIYIYELNFLIWRLVRGWWCFDIGHFGNHRPFFVATKTFFFLVCLFFAWDDRRFFNLVSGNSRGYCQTFQMFFWHIKPAVFKRRRRHN